MIAEEKLKKVSSLESKIDALKKEFYSTMNIMREYDTVSVRTKCNYFVISVFSVLITVCNYEQVDSVIYALVEVLFFTFVSVSVYVFSVRGKKR